jgi:kynureninase
MFSPAPGVACPMRRRRPAAGADRAGDARAIDAWQAGTADWIVDWDRPAEAARASFAALVGSTVGRVALLPALSVGVGYVATGLGSGDQVVVPSDEFTSVLFPLLLARERGARVREVPFERLVDEIGVSTTLVALSHTQMQTGRTAPLAAILDRAEAVGARVLLDVTQAVPLVPLAPYVDRIDYLVASGYKHLLCPRGTAFLVVRPDRLADLPPLDANWRQDQPYGRFGGRGRRRCRRLTCRWRPHLGRCDQSPGCSSRGRDRRLSGVDSPASWRTDSGSVGRASPVR